MEKIKFKDLPLGARFKYRDEASDDFIYCLLERHGSGLVAKYVEKPSALPNVHMQEIFSAFESPEHANSQEVYFIN